MDFQKIVDGIPVMTCAVSIEVFEDERPNIFRIVAGNKPYVDSIEHPQPGMKMLKDKFVPGSEYTDYLTRDLNFEDYCYRAAVEKKCLHSYVHPDRMNVWLNMMFIPLWEDHENIHYCLYLMEATMEAEAENLSTFSSSTAVSVLDSCIRLRGTNDFKGSMKKVVKEIRDLCDAEHCCILIVNEEERSCSVLGEAFAEGSPLLPMEHYLDDDFYDITETWNTTIAGSNCIIAKDEKDMQVVKERNPVWYESLTAAGAHNVALFPLKSQNHTLGYMWALNFDREFAEKIKETLEVTTFIVGAEIGNILLLDRFRTLSSRDLLTGVMNRNEMNNYVSNLCSFSGEDKKAVGVIFADLNGLKAVNDIEGHAAGDLLLKNAANALREVFEDKEIFRAGGVEFAIIITDITKDDLDGKIQGIRQACSKYDNLVFALGGSVEEDCRNVRMALRHADENMYEDKRIFYEQNPERADENRIGHSADNSVDDEFRRRTAFSNFSFDRLTGLPDMAHFFRYAESGRKNMHDRGIPSVIAFADLNGMKYYNKKYGFSEGDVLIRDVATVLGELFGEENCSRFGQDHFAWFTEAEGLEQKLERLFAKARRANGGRALPVRVGVYPDSMGLVETSLACDRAKAACDSKKDDSGSFYVFFDDRMLSKETNRQYIIEHLDRAINENWIKPFYQPIIRSTNRKVCDEEALARWIDPEKGMMSPADFIPILEEEKLIYKVDLHILDYSLERLVNQKKLGMHRVPISINLSRTDFESCDIVQEIDNRVTTSGVPRDLITIEITESVVGENFDFVKEQVDRFRKLGFSVWMDDFGSGYSSLDLLLEIQFDLIKFDMRFMRQFDNRPQSRVLLTELMRMAQSLGYETVCEGVETEEQVAFLREIGCTKMQGFYFCKPIPLEEIRERYEKGTQIGFENPEEVEYHRVVGSFNMYDLSSVYGEESDRQASAKNYFDTMPMAIMEYDGVTTKVIRCNKSYRDFGDRFRDISVTPGPELIKAFDTCREPGARAFLDEKTEDGSTIHAMVKKIIDNPVSGNSAYVVVVLQIIPETEQQLTYADVAQALSSDYIYLYYVDTETDQFVEYSPDEKSGLSVERHGEDFFNQTASDVMTYIYEDDREDFLKLITKENILNTLREQGVFVHNYRLMIEDTPTYVNMKIVRIREDDSHIIIGVNNVDSQMRQQETIERLREEKTTYSRISALMGDFIAIYTVDPDTGNYMEYSSSEAYSTFGAPKVGLDFFEDSLKNVQRAIHPDDLEYFKSVFSREKVLERTKEGKIFKINYRLVFGEETVIVSLRAGIVAEKDGPQLIVGVSRSSENE